MTRDEARKQAEERVYVDMTAGSIMVKCDELGYKYKTKKDGLFCACERSKCEQYLIEYFTEQFL